MVSSIPDLTWSATAGTWSQNYTYDNFGNLTGTNGAAVWSFDPATNHPTGTGTTDNNGNSLANSNVWDVENRLVSTLNANGYQTMTYQYDPWGKRISQAVGSFASSKTIYFYSITGQRLQTFLCTSDDGNGNPRCLLQQSDVYFGRKLILAGTSPSGVSPVATDRLGSIRYNSAGNLSYYPYGQEHSQPTTQDNTDKFATYFRDWVGQDYADQRYYNQAGRFFTPDPAGMRNADPSDPGSWNRYAYVQGDPINFFDPSGQLRANPDAPITGPDWGYNQFPCGPGWATDTSLQGPCGGELNQDCRNLFGTARTRQGKWDPTVVLISLFVAQDGKYGAVNFDYTGTGAALTTPSGFPLPSLNAGVTGTSATISINLSSWDIDNIGYNAETLLHEMGHLYNFVRGSGGFAVPNRAELTDDQAFDKVIDDKCNIHY